MLINLDISLTRVSKIDGMKVIPKVLIGAYEDTKDCRERPDTIGLVLAIITLTLRYPPIKNTKCNNITCFLLSVIMLALGIF